MQMEKIECRSAAFFDLQTQARIKRFFTGAANPEIALAGFGHLYHPLFHGPAADHDAVDLQAAFRREEFDAAGDTGAGHAFLQGCAGGSNARAGPVLLWQIIAARHNWPSMRTQFRSAGTQRENAPAGQDQSACAPDI
jgi:hypothetical protein